MAVMSYAGYDLCQVKVGILIAIIIITVTETLTTSFFLINTGEPYLVFGGVEKKDVVWLVSQLSCALIL